MCAYGGLVIISHMKVKKCLEKGCVVFLASATEKPKEVVKFEDIEVVRD